MAAAGNPMGLYVFGAIAAVIGISVIAYYVARSMKGRMKLVVPKARVQSGEALSGSLLVQAKRPIPVDRMFVALIGERQVRKRTSNNGNSTSWVEFYRDEADVVMDEVFHAGFSKNYSFSFTAPTKEDVENDRAALEKLDNAIENIDNPLAKSIAKGVSGMAKASRSMNRGRRRWKIVSRLETKGVDLADSQTVHVSLKSIG